jgi:hypothetical protein
MSVDDLFGDEVLKNPDRHMVLVELRREIAVRNNVYPNWVLNGRLTQESADFRIACLHKAIELLNE